MIRRPPRSTLFPHDALPISHGVGPPAQLRIVPLMLSCMLITSPLCVSNSIVVVPPPAARRSEEHTSELQSQSNLVCRLLLEKKNKYVSTSTHIHNLRQHRHQ